jgi:hypothetical protein
MKLSHLAGDVVTDVHLLVVQKHTVHSLDGAFSGLGSFVVHKTITLGLAMFIGRNLARQDIAESSESVMKGLKQK